MSLRKRAPFRFTTADSAACSARMLVRYRQAEKASPTRTLSPSMGKRRSNC